MESKALVLTNKNEEMTGAFIWNNIDCIRNTYDDNCSISRLLSKIGDNSNRYRLFIIELNITVLDLLKLINEVKRIFHLPICVFENNIIERYPGEREKLNGKIDIIIQRKIKRNDFFWFIDKILDLNKSDVYDNMERKITNGSILIYPNKRILYINNIKINLTKKEFDIFCYLFNKKGDVVSHKELYENVWGKIYMHDDTNIMAHVHRLRNKVEKDPKNPRYICNQYGIGYYFGDEF